MLLLQASSVSISGKLLLRLLLMLLLPRFRSPDRSDTTRATRQSTKGQGSLLLLLLLLATSVSISGRLLLLLRLLRLLLVVIAPKLKPHLNQVRLSELLSGEVGVKLPLRSPSLRFTHR